MFDFMYSDYPQQHYPKTRKYISLFPPSARGTSDSLVDEAEQAKTDTEREELRTDIRHRMEEGKLPGEPEKTLDGGQREVDMDDEGVERDVDLNRGGMDVDVEEPARPTREDVMKTAKTKTKTKNVSKGAATEETAKPPTLASDAFFDEDD